jgi:hypothetical protein
VAALLVLSAAFGGCGGRSPAAQRARSGRATTGLQPTPLIITRTCRQASRRVAFGVLCPVAWPSAPSAIRPQLRWLALTSHVYLLDALDVVDDRRAHVFHVLIGGQQHGFGSRGRAVDPGLRITTKLVRIPIRGGGTFVQQRPAQRIGTTTVNGTPALLLREPPYPQGGIHGGHILILWNHAGHGYVASVHGIGMTPPALIQTVIALARSEAR